LKGHVLARPVRDGTGYVARCECGRLFRSIFTTRTRSLLDAHAEHLRQVRLAANPTQCPHGIRLGEPCPVCERERLEPTLDEFDPSLELQLQAQHANQEERKRWRNKSA